MARNGISGYGVLRQTGPRSQRLFRDAKTVRFVCLFYRENTEEPMKDVSKGAASNLCFRKISVVTM